MAFLHPLSCECAKSELDLFSLPSTQTSIIGGHWVEYNPLSALSTGGPIEFSVSGSGDDYLDLTQSWLQVTAKVTKSDGTKLDPKACLAPENNWLHTLFSQIDLSLNDTVVSPSNNTYPYRAYIENLLTYGPEAKDTQLTSQLFYTDTVNKFDIIPDPEKAGENYGMDQRREFAEGSDVIEMIGRLHLDIFNQPKLLLNGVDLKVRLNRSRNNFNLHYSPAVAGYKTEILEATLYVRKIKLNPKVQMAHIKALERGTAKYPVRRVEMKTFSVPSGEFQAKQPNLFLGQRPVRLVVGVVDNDAFNGNPLKSPFNFKNYNMNFVAVYIDGTQVPTKAYEPNFKNKGGCMRSYFSLFQGTGKLGLDKGNEIGRTDYVGEGYALHVIDLTPDMNDGGQLQLRQRGSVGLEIHFAEALPNTVNVMVYSEFENLIEIDRNRRVIYDYAS